MELTNLSLSVPLHEKYLLVLGVDKALGPLLVLHVKH
jgi:hypothetical protein